MSFDQVYEKLDGGTPRDQYEMASRELQRRYLKDIHTSSRNLEKLTARLINWTIVLAVLSVVLALDVGNNVRKEYISEPPRLTAPQTPVPPPR